MIPNTKNGQFSVGIPPVVVVDGSAHPPQTGLVRAEPRLVEGRPTSGCSKSESRTCSGSPSGDPYCFVGKRARGRRSRRRSVGFDLMQFTLLPHSTPLAAIVGTLGAAATESATASRAAIARLIATVAHAGRDSVRAIADAATIRRSTNTTVTVDDEPLLKFGPGGDHVENMFGLASSDCTLLLRSRSLERLPSSQSPAAGSQEMPSTPVPGRASIAAALRDLRARGLSVASAGEAGDRILAIRDLRPLNERPDEPSQPAVRGLMAVARIRAAADAWRRRLRSDHGNTATDGTVADGADRPRRRASSRRARRERGDAALTGTTLFDTIVASQTPSAAAASIEPPS